MAADAWNGLAASRRDRLLAGLSRKPLRVAFRPSPETDGLSYFHDDLDRELQALSSAAVQFQPGSGPLGDVDLLLITSHSGDLSPYITDLRSRLPDGALVASWFWDNHTAPVPNLRTALAADFAIASHAYCADALLSVASVLAGTCPLCCAQWSESELQRYFAQIHVPARSSQLLVNYVDYGFSWRSALLKALRREMPKADVLLMQPEDRSRYFNKDRAARFAEWTGYKTTLILPVVKDLSTRLFDALAAGLVPVVPQGVLDLDHVIPPAVQQSLGIVRFGEISLPSIQAAHARAVETFDRLGPAGVEARHRFVMQHHLLRHRIAALAEMALALPTGRALLDWTQPPLPMGLLLRPR